MQSKKISGLHLNKVGLSSFNPGWMCEPGMFYRDLVKGGGGKGEIDYPHLRQLTASSVWLDTLPFSKTNLEGGDVMGLSLTRTPFHHSTV